MVDAKALAALQKEVGEWSIATFGAPADDPTRWDGHVEHLRREAVEYDTAKTREDQVEELADLAILLMGLAWRLEVAIRPPPWGPPLQYLTEGRMDREFARHDPTGRSLGQRRNLVSVAWWYAVVREAYYQDIDLLAAVRNKMTKNYRRKWKPADANGVIEHAA